jgi:very-short-patch-repair endonuclease
MRYLPVNKVPKQFSRELCNNASLGETLLWKQLVNRQVHGYLFNHQKPLEHFVVTFFCQPLKLVIEVDAPPNSTKETLLSEKERKAVLNSMGVILLAFTEEEIRRDVQKVMAVIESQIITIEENNPDIKKKNRKPVKA